MQEVKQSPSAWLVFLVPFAGSKFEDYGAMIHMSNTRSHVCNSLAIGEGIDSYDDAAEVHHDSW